MTARNRRLVEAAEKAMLATCAERDREPTLALAVTATG